MRPALELAVAVARRGEDADPPVAAPNSLRRYLSWRQLPPAALRTVAQVLDDDDGFRTRVAAVATELDTPARLFLERPEGWEEAFEEAVDLEEATDDADAGSRLRGLERRLATTEAKLAEGVAARREAEARAETHQAALAEERRARRAAREEVGALRVELDAVVEQLALVERQRGDAEGALAARDRELERAHARVGELEAALVRIEETGVPPGVDPAALEPLVRRLQVASDHVVRSVVALAGAVEAATPADGDPVTGGGDEVGPGRSGPAPGGSRRPSRMPGGLHEGTTEGAAWLVRRPGAVLLVDGYNVSMGAWPGEPIAVQRDRLVRRLGVLAARTAGDVHVVFDGRERSSRAGRDAPPGVRVTYTEAGVEADDEILAEVARIPLDRPVVVVSSDRRVADGARERGANVLGSDLLVDLLREG